MDKPAGYASFKEVSLRILDQIKKEQKNIRM